jgi:adenine deaminase
MMTLKNVLAVVCVAALVAAGGARPSASQTGGFDLVIAGGRVIDPESGLDAVRHVGVRGDRIASVSEAPLQGRETIDATGLVVSPGFLASTQT